MLLPTGEQRSPIGIGIRERENSKMENQNLKSCISYLYEYRDELDTAVRNATNVMEETQELVDMIKNNKKKKHKFKDFLDSYEETIVGYKNQIEVLKEKNVYAKAVIELYEQGHKPEATAGEKAQADLIEQTVTTLFLAFSIVPTMTEQRIEAEAKAKAQQEEEENKKADE